MPGTNLFTDSKISGVQVALTDNTGVSYLAKCTGVPPTTTAGVFAHGCLCIQTDSGTGNQSLYENTGTSDTPVWNLVGSISPGEITLAQGSLLVGQVTGKAGAAAPSGDVSSISAAGVFQLSDYAVHITGKNMTGGALTPGTLVFPSTDSGEIRFTKPSAGSQSAPAIYVVTQSIADTATGLAYATAVVTGLNTAAAGAVGDPVYLSAVTPGAFAFSAPTAIDSITDIVGVVLAKDAVNGSILFFPGAVLYQQQPIEAQKLNTSVFNNTGGILAAGTLVALSGYSVANALPQVVKADADAGIVATHFVLSSIAIGGQGQVWPLGLCTNLNTNALGAAGTVLYLDTVAGGVTATKNQSANSIQQEVGVVVVQNAVTGSIFFYPGLRRVVDNRIQYVEVSLSSAQLLALRATPVEVIPAIAGQTPQVLNVQALYDYGGTAYTVTNAGDDIALKLNNAAGVQVSETIECTGFIDQAADQVEQVGAKTQAISTGANTNGASVVAHNIGAAEFTLGNGVVRLKISFRYNTSGF